LITFEGAYDVAYETEQRGEMGSTVSMPNVADQQKFMKPVNGCRHDVTDPLCEYGGGFQARVTTLRVDEQTMIHV
jgi:hypothetical protein